MMSLLRNTLATVNGVNLNAPNESFIYYSAPPRAKRCPEPSLMLEHAEMTNGIENCTCRTPEARNAE